VPSDFREQDLRAKLGRIASREREVVVFDRHAPFQAGHPVRRDVSYGTNRLWEYWIARSSRATTPEQAFEI
jgi:hypothetical protein